MDELLLQHTLMSDEEEMDVLDDEEYARAVAATLVAGVELAWLHRMESHRIKFGSCKQLEPRLRTFRFALPSVRCEYPIN